MKVVDSSLETSFRFPLPEMNKIWFLLVLEIRDLNNHIWTFRLGKLFLCKSCLQIMLWKWLRVRWKCLLMFFFLKWTNFDFYCFFKIWNVNNNVWAFRPEKLFLRKSCLRIMLWKWLRARWKRFLEFFFLKQKKIDFYHFYWSGT